MLRQILACGAVLAVSVFSVGCRSNGDHCGAPQCGSLQRTNMLGNVAPATPAYAAANSSPEVVPVTRGVQQQPVSREARLR